MRRVRDVNYELLSHQRKNIFAQRNRLIPFHLVVPHLEKFILHFKMFSFNTHILISSFNPADEGNSPERSPYDSLENFDNETTPDFILTDRHHTSLSSTEEDISSPIMFDNSQQTQTTSFEQTNTNQADTIL